MKRKETVSIFRVLAIFVIVAMTGLVSAFFCWQNQYYADEWLCILFLDLVFLMILIFELEYERKRRMLSFNMATTFFRVAAGYAFCCLISMAFPYLPEFFCPVLLIPLIMESMSNETLAIVTGIFLNLLFGMISSGNYYELVCYCLLTILGGVLAKTLDSRKFRFCTAILLFCISILFPVVFYYWSYKEITLTVYLYGAASGLVTLFMALVVYDRLRQGKERELENRYLDILSEDYHAVKELKKFFPADYRHAERVSVIMTGCAKALGYDVLLCTAAGFYYRMGKWQGEQDHVANGVRRARQLCFPGELVQILAEYYGEERLPRTPESALVHMVDAVALKMDAMNQNVGQSQWNHEMIIYQTLNEYSSNGLYDESGMGMNQFLKVREYLVKEKLLQ